MNKYPILHNHSFSRQRAEVNGRPARTLAEVPLQHAARTYAPARDRTPQARLHT